MVFEVIAIGGFSEIGRNCCAVKVDDEIVILDMGLHMERYIEHHSYATFSHGICKDCAGKALDGKKPPD